MSLLIAGYTPFSTVDYPGHTAAVVFTQGCPWRCRYCQNASLQPLEAPQGAPAWEEFLEWLEGRRGLLDAVVFSGGEPTLQASELHKAMIGVKGLGFKIGLHSAGMFSDAFGMVLSLCDWVGLDIKATFGKQGWITGNEFTGVARSYISLGHLGASDVPFEIRTTYHPALLGKDIKRIASALSAMRPLDWVIQRFQPNSPDPELNAAGPAVVSAEILEQLRAVAPNLNISVR